MYVLSILGFGMLTHTKELNGRRDWWLLAWQKREVEKDWEWMKVTRDHEQKTWRWERSGNVKLVQFFLKKNIALRN